MTTAPSIATAKRMRAWLTTACLALVLAVGGDLASVAQEPVPVKPRSSRCMTAPRRARPTTREFIALPKCRSITWASFCDFRMSATACRTRRASSASKACSPGLRVRYLTATPMSRGCVRRPAGMCASSFLGTSDPIDPRTIPAVNQVFALAGVRHTGEFVAPTLGTRMRAKGPNLVEFECRLGPVLPDYPIINATGADARIGVMLQTPAYDGGRKSVLVAIRKEAPTQHGITICASNGPRCIRRNG